MNVFLTTLGCRLNEAEVETWSRELEEEGHLVVGGPERADVMVVNTCAVTSQASRKSRKFIGGVHRQNPEARLVVTGCYSQLEPESAARQVGVDLVVGNTEKDKLVSILGTKLDLSAMPTRAEEPDGTHAFRATHTRAFIKVQDGCRNRCTFCIVTIARGQERSRAISEIVREINLLANRGYQEVVLTGVHLGGYGSDIGKDLVELVETVLRETNIPRVRLSSLEPWDLPSDFAKLWKNPRLMPHLHLPLQSGSDSVLKRMARRCPTDQYRALVADLRNAIPGFVLTTDLIVGFPGETDDDWQDSLSLVSEIGFSHMHIFAFSPREGTTAARMPMQLANSVKKARSSEMRELAQTMKAERLAKYVGTKRDVLWEREGEVRGGKRHYAGYTDNYLRVEITTDLGHPSLENRITSASLESISQDRDCLVARHLERASVG